MEAANMEVRLGEKIRMLRHRDGRTQEALANAIGVTSQAVSRWEAGGGYPDIETIPAIADFFHVTIDQLFGYDGDREATIQQILKDADNAIRKGFDPDRELDAIRAAADTYPSETRIQLRLGILLMIHGFEVHGARCSIPSADHDGENMVDHNRQNPDFAEALTVFERILPQLTEPEDRERVIRNMVRLYAIRGEYSKAEALARSQDSIAICREVLLPSTAVGTQRTVYQGKLLLSLLSSIANLLIAEVSWRSELRHTRLGMEKLLELARFYERIFNDGSLGSGHHILMTIYYQCARFAAEQGMTTQARTYAHLWYDHYRAYARVKQAGGQFRYTAILLQGVTEPVDGMPPLRTWKETLDRQTGKLKDMLMEDDYFRA